MKMIEIKLRSQTAELEKLTARKERAEAKLQKATEKAEKLYANFESAEAYRAWMDTVETNEGGWIVSKKDIDRNGAYLSLSMARDEVEEVEKAIKRAEDRFEKTETEVETYREQVKTQMSAKAYEDLMKVTFEEEQKEWAKDGVKLEGRYYGETPNGKRFDIYGNHGFTERSRHCFTLTICGETIFTSGEFWRCYSVIKNR